MFCVNLWNKRKLDLAVLKEHGFDHLIFWYNVENDVLKKAHDAGFKNVIMPPLVFREHNLEVLQDIDGNPVPEHDSSNYPQQVALFAGPDWADKNLELLDGAEYDGVLCTDIPWHTQIRTKIRQSEFNDKCYFNHPKDVELLRSEFGILEKYVIDRFSDKTRYANKWKREYIVEAARAFYTRFEVLCAGLKEGAKGWYPLQVSTQDAFQELNSHKLFYVFESFCQNNDLVVMVQNFSKISGPYKHFYREMVKGSGSVLIGGTDGALGLVKGNGRDAFNEGYAGTITEEHHLYDNRHPSFSQIRSEMRHLIDNYQR